jgi:cation diffusion facilitator CzcD-associated flavoprotein CzcO
MTTTADKRVCIVGAGIAGLVTAKVLKADGFAVHVFEKEPTLGGVWTTSRTYPELQTNTTREQYAFSDFPFPRTADDFPTAEQVRRYLNAYADHFDLRDLLHFSTEVVSISRVPSESQESKPRFQVVVRPSSGGEASIAYDFDFVAVCNGVFSVPHMPQIERQEQFAGPIIHSSQFTDAGLVKGARAVVVGAGKSALDCATVAARHARSCTLLVRSPRWTAPRYFFGVRYDHLFFNRFFEAFYRYHRLGPFEAFLHGPARPFVRLFWKVQSQIVRRVLDVPPELVPDEPLPGRLDIGVGGDVYAAVREGQAAARRAEIVSFTGSSTAKLSTGEEINADVVIFATGWEQPLDFLDSELRRHVKKDGHFHLYRHILPPDAPRLGFVGYAQSFMTPLTSEIAAHWLSEHFLGELELPSKEEMKREIARVRQWANDVFWPAREGYFVGPHISHYIDELMRDLGLPRMRTGNLAREWFGRFLPERYRSVADERRNARHAHARHVDE